MSSLLNHLPVAAASKAAEVFRAALPIALAVGIVIIVLHFAVFLVRRKAAGPRKPWHWWESPMYLGAVAIIGYLGFTSLVAVYRLGGIGGWWLLAHMFGAGAMVVMLPVLAVVWADANRFQLGGDRSAASKFLGLTKLAFWTILASGLLVSGTMIASMLPWLGSGGQRLLLDVHRYAGLVCVVAASVHVYGVLAGMLRKKAAGN
jgi:hypothetical protein